MPPGPGSINPITQNALETAQNERSLAIAQLREIASERNHLRRELALLEESIARLKTVTPIEALQGQIETLSKRVEELTNALEAERSVTQALRDSISWKLTTPLRAWMRLVRRES